MPDHAKYYVLGAFLLGAALTAAHNRRSQGEASDDANSERQIKQQHRLLSKLSKINDLDTLKKTLAELESLLERGEANIKEGIEGCIGDTPLIKIKSLSDYTGCEILAKAEVRETAHTFFRITDSFWQFLNGAGNSPKDRVALSIIEMVMSQK
jgi:cysteine synthase A